MKRLVFLMAVCLSANCLASTIFSADDIEFWVGSGENRAVLVIDWNDELTPTSLAWGFCWSGTATGRDMLNAVLAADTRLFEQFGSFGQSAVYGLGFDLDEDGFAYAAGPDDTGHALDADDHYREGWMTAGYWSYWGCPVNPYDGGIWDYPGSGLADRILTSGCWDGWSFAPAPDWYSGAPDLPAAASVPEPASLFLLAAGGLLLRNRKK